MKSDQGFSLSVYQPELQHILVAGVQPLEIDATYDEWLAELQVSLITRVIEYEIDRNKKDPFNILSSLSRHNLVI